MATKKPATRAKAAAKAKKPAAGKALPKKAGARQVLRPAVSKKKSGKVGKPLAPKKSGKAGKPAAESGKSAAAQRTKVKPPAIKPSRKAKPAVTAKKSSKAKPVAKGGKPAGKLVAKVGPKAAPPRKEPKPTKPVMAKVEPKAEPKVVEPPKPRPTAFAVGDKVVHPQHGAAVIAKRIKQQLADKVKDYFVLDIATDQLKVFVPVEKIDEVIRPVISKNQTRLVFTKFREEPQEAGSNWSRWYKVLNEKMTSGDIYQVAEVVRDLTFAQQTKGISPALKRMLSRARLTLISEIRFALDIDEEEATRRLDKALPKVENPIPLPV